ncbi:protein of unknown function [Noviherbaspirillum humi]|uniref:DUF4154 domain-containing protein n=1 Tax=Noviherbaspirillum humi TaxID=1688639 RepID=A0A239IGJ7_9BURK|nr:YfiR family protein [Noviherbaspirillum humi]SNS91534.1 protein of unknown function [Noviherbaspirillum humi]
MLVHPPYGRRAAPGRGPAWLLQTALLLALALGMPPLQAQLAPPPEASVPSGATVEQRVKAASLYRFPGYVEWPAWSFPDAAAPYIVGVAGAPEIAQELGAISAGRTVNNRPLQVRRLKAGEALAGIHLLFIGRDEQARQGAWLQAAQKLPVLTVTESEPGLAQDSMINFRLADERVRFEVNLDAVERSELRVSSRMLSVALSVHKGARP